MSARPRIGTAALVVSTAVITAALTAGGPAIASTVVDFAKNAGAVDGKQAVQANASVNQRKGKLVATAKGSGLLPNNIIAQAPNSAKLGGIAVTGFAPHFLTAHGNWVPATAGVTFCKTTVFTPSTNSVAVVNVSADATGPAATLWAAQAAVSADGGTTFARTIPNWYTGATSQVSEYSAVSNSANVPLRKGMHYAFAGTGFSDAAMSGGDCTVTVAIYPALPGTSMSAPTTPSVATAEHPAPGSVNAARNR